MQRPLLTNDSLKQSVREMLERAERQDPQHLVATFVDPGGLAAALDNDNNQVLFGRRGTGKTHVLRVLEAQRRDDVLAVFIDLRTVAETPRVGDEKLSEEIRAAILFQILMREIEKAISAQRDFGRHASAELTAFRAAISAVALVDETVEFFEATTTKLDDRSELGGQLGTAGPSVSGSIETTASREDSAQNRRQGGRPVAQIMFADVARTLRSLLVHSGITRVLLILDEWTELPYRLQPVTADYLRRAFFAENLITIKISSVEYRSAFVTVGPHNSRVGIELGSDVGLPPRLDSQLVYQCDPDAVVLTFRKLLFRHVAVGMAIGTARTRRQRFAVWRRWLRRREDVLSLAEQVGDTLAEDHWGFTFVDRLGPNVMKQMAGVSTDLELVTGLFTDRDGGAFHELVHASQGVVRDFLSLFSKAFEFSASRGANKIDRQSIRRAARDHYEQAKARNLPVVEETVLERIFHHIESRGETDLFYLPHDVEEEQVVQALHDHRLIYLVERGKTFQGNPRRYQQYAVDYGLYASLIDRETHQRGGRGRASKQDAKPVLLTKADLGL
jgi:Cdc6-like AAA superfamily ATPase